MVSGLPVNDVLDPDRLPRPRFAYTALLRSMVARRGTALAFRKRDARHYFHHVRLGAKWWMFLILLEFMVTTAAGASQCIAAQLWALHPQRGGRKV